MKLPLALTATISCFLLAAPASAGPYADKMATCLVDNTTRAEQQTLMRWMVVAISQHPKVADIVKMDQGQREKTQRDMAKLFTSLLADRCTSAAVQAYQYEGGAAFEAAFNVLGQVAAGSLMNSPAVNKSMTEFESYLDQEKLNKVFN